MSEQNAERAVPILVKAAAFAELNLEDVHSDRALSRGSEQIRPCDREGRS